MLLLEVEFGFVLPINDAPTSIVPAGSSAVFNLARLWDQVCKHSINARHFLKMSGWIEDDMNCHDRELLDRHR